MKKSQLRNIIRESIKQLMTEQGGTTHQIVYSNAGSIPYHGYTLSGPGACTGKTYIGTASWVVTNVPYMCTQNDVGITQGGPGAKAQFIADNYGDSANFSDYAMLMPQAGQAPPLCGFGTAIQLYAGGLGNNPSYPNNPVQTFTNFDQLKSYANSIGAIPTGDPNQICSWTAGIYQHTGGHGNFGVGVGEISYSNFNSPVIPGGVNESSPCEVIITPPPVEKYRCYDCNTPCSQQLIDAGHCPYDTTQECMDQCTETDKWSCGRPDKFGNPRCRKCKEFELTDGTTCYPTEQDCLNSGDCDMKKVKDDKTITTPFTTDPQSKIGSSPHCDPPCDEATEDCTWSGCVPKMELAPDLKERMQQLAKIK
mgnify:CR=1 FL=1